MIWFIIASPFFFVGVVGMMTLMGAMVYATYNDLFAARPKGTAWDVPFCTGVFVIWLGSSAMLLAGYGITRIAS